MSLFLKLVLFVCFVDLTLLVLNLIAMFWFSVVFSLFVCCG